VPQDPGTRKVESGVKLLRATGCNIVAVVGGGSPLCAGKAIALVATNGGNIRDYEGLEKYQNPPLPVIAIPTTAGSGSEVSASFIISDEQRDNYKLTVNGYHCYPKVALLDPLLVRSLPPRQFIYSGVDALVHAIEATCTTQSTPLTDAIAYDAVRLIFNNLSRAACSGDLEAKGLQLLASTMANIACGNAKLGLVHSMSQPLGSFYHLAHGLTNGILLPYVMEYNLPAAVDKLAGMAAVLGLAGAGPGRLDQARAAIKAIKDLLDVVDFPDRIPEEKVPREDIPRLAKTAMGRSQVKLNLRKPTEGDVVEIYERAFQGWR